MYCQADPIESTSAADYAVLFPQERILPCGSGAKWSVLPGDGKTLVYWEFEPRELPTHSHPEKQSGYVLEGEMALVGPDGSECILKAGDFYSIPGSEPHGAVVKERVVIVDVYEPKRRDLEARFNESLRATQALQAGRPALRLVQ